MEQTPQSCAQLRQAGIAHWIPSATIASRRELEPRPFAWNSIPTVPDDITYLLATGESTFPYYFSPAEQQCVWARSIGAGKRTNRNRDRNCVAPGGANSAPMRLGTNREILLLETNSPKSREKPKRRESASKALIPFKTISHIVSQRENKYPDAAFLPFRSRVYGQRSIGGGKRAY